MSTTISMWLGIVFVVAGVAAVILQAWLWSFPMLPDPGGSDPHGKTSAPALWRYVHRGLGYVYLVIYVVLMTEMVPRLWNYQFELPARTVIHACMGIIIGCLLLTKISILRWFQHFGGALPAVGLSLGICTVLLGVLSIPFALRAHDFGDALTAENLERVERTLADIQFDEKWDIKELASKASFEKGLQTLTSKCTQCHDVRTILNKPRTGKGWYDVVKRMSVKPSLGKRILADEIPFVTAYLVAITPAIQESNKRKAASDKSQSERVEKVKATAAAPAVPAEPGADPKAGKALFESKCSACHELKDVADHGKEDLAGWTKVVTRMVEENGAELAEKDVKTIIAYLVATQGK